MNTHSKLLKCNACADVMNEKGIICPLCRMAYHTKCILNPPRTRSAYEVWRCPACHTKPLRGINDDTPIKDPQRHLHPALLLGAGASGYTTPTTEPETNEQRITTEELLSSAAQSASRLAAPPADATKQRTDTVIIKENECKQSAAPSERVTVGVAELTAEEIVDFGTAIRAARQEILDFRVSIERCHCRVDEHIEKLDLLDRRLVKLEERESENTLLREKVERLEYELNSRDQTNMHNDIELSGVTEQPGENLLHVVSVVAVKIGVTLDERDIDYATRVGPRRSSGGDGRPRPVVVRLCRRAVRNQLLKAARVRRGLSTSDINMSTTGSTQNNNIYLNERLTKQNRQLFHKARSLAKTNNFRYVWTNQGQIFVRKEHGSTAIRIEREIDLSRIERGGVAARARHPRYTY